MRIQFTFNIVFTMGITMHLDGKSIIFHFQRF
jgi:hypothetical protein